MVRDLRRDRSAGHSRVTNIELFFDLVYVFAVTQLSHYLLVMVAGIIVIAAADDITLSHPRERAGLATALLILGGTALYLAGHAAFKAVVWRVVSWPRLGGVAALGVLGLLAPHVSVLALAACAAAVVVGVAVADYLGRGPDEAEPDHEQPKIRS